MFSFRAAEEETPQPPKQPRDRVEADELGIEKLKALNIDSGGFT